MSSTQIRQRKNSKPFAVGLNLTSTIFCLQNSNYDTHAPAKTTNGTNFLLVSRLRSSHLNQARAQRELFQTSREERNSYVPDSISVRALLRDGWRRAQKTSSFLAREKNLDDKLIDYNLHKLRLRPATKSKKTRHSIYISKPFTSSQQD